MNNSKAQTQKDSHIESRLMTRLISLFLFVTMILAGSVFSGVATADIIDGKYGVAQVFDVERSPSTPVAGSPFTASGMALPLKDSSGQYAIGTGYIQFFYTGDVGNPVGIKRYDSGGVLQETISTSGKVYGLGAAGFLYVSVTGGYDTFVANSSGYNLGGSVTYTPTVGLASTSDLNSYGATSVPLAPGETAITVTGVGGTVTCPPTANWGTSPACSITSVSGYHVYGVWVDNIEDETARNQSILGINSTITSYSLGNTTTPRITEVRFRKNTFKVTPSVVGGNGTVTCPNTYENFDATPTCTITPASGYHVQSLTIAGTTDNTGFSNILTNGVNTTIASKQLAASAVPGSDRTITATFIRNTFAVTPSVSGGNGTVTCPNAFENFDATPTCTITPDTGYHVYDLTISGTTNNTGFSNHSITGDNTTIASKQLFASAAPGSIRTITAVFRKNTYLVSSATSGIGSGTNTVATTSQVSHYADHGSSATFLIDEAEGSKITGVSGDGVCGAVTGTPWDDNPAPPTNHGKNATYNAASVTGTCTVTATFAADATKPVTTFAVPASVTSLLNVPIVTFTATDNVHVKEYCIIQDSATQPLINSACWTTTAPATFTMTGAEGLHTLYAWTKDYANNVSVVKFNNITFDASNRINLPRSGQNRCYDAAGLSATCVVSGQDGESQSGLAWPTVRFASGVGVDATTAVITDTLTGLMFPKDFNKVPSTQDWKTALATVAAMNVDTYGGYSDWRLPNRNEMASLVNRVRSDSASWLTTLGFINVKPNIYWTSTTETATPEEAWSVNLLEGSITSQAKNTANYIVPVRAWQGLGISQPIQTGQTLCYNTTTNAPTSCIDSVSGIHTGQDGDQKAGIPWPAARFGNANGTTLPTGSVALDRLTGLVWPLAVGDSGLKTWQGALDYVKTLNSANYRNYADWRLANSVELQSLYNGGVGSGITWLQGQGFSNIQSTGYWTGTSDVNKAKNAWVYNIDNGDLIYSDKITTTFHALVVRGGLIGSGTIIVTPANPDLGQQAYGSVSAKQEVTINNAGASELQISSLTLDNGNDGAFALDVAFGSKPCASYAPAIAATDHCTIGISFTPATSGAKNATLTITNSDSSHPALDVTMTGTGVSAVSGRVPNAHGTVDCPGTVVSGGSSICTITPEVGYHLISLTDTAASNPVGNVYTGMAQTSYTVTNITINRDVTAGFAIDTFAPGVAFVGAGTLSCLPANYGSASTCTVAPTNAASHHLASLTDNGTDVTSAVSGTTYSINNITAAHNLVATFELNTYPVTATSSGNGTIICSPATVSHGSNSVCTIVTTLPGHHLATLADNTVSKIGSVTGSGPYSYTISNVTVAHTLAADFAITTYTISIPFAANGTSSPAISTTVTYNSTVTITLAPLPNFRLASADGCNGTLSGNQYTLAPVTADCTVTTSYEHITHSVAINAGSGGTVSPNSTQTVNQVSTQAFTITPSSGFVITSATGCGGALSGPVSSDYTYTTAAVSADCAVNVSFNDTTVPLVSAFAIPTTGSTLTIPVAVFNATDNSDSTPGSGITGWYISASAARPDPTPWLNSKPVSHTLSTTQPNGTLTPAGQKTLYAWVRDAVGNVSSVASAATTITFPAPVRLIQSGQTVCYDGSGSILCTNTSETQDGKIQAGLPRSTPDFIYNGDNTQSDTTTGLMWTQSANVIYTRSNYTVSPGTTDWQGALDYVRTMNAEWFSGYSDWRLPNRNELLSLMSYGVSGGLVTHLKSVTPIPFIDVPANAKYWSSTSQGSQAFQLQLDGRLIAVSKGIGTTAYLMAVRTPKVDDSSGFIAPRTSLLATGQAACSDNSGAARPCVDNSAVHTGEDGDTQAGMPFSTPRFVSSIDNSTTFDQSSGLTWLHDAHAPVCGAFTGGTVKTFTDSLAYIGCLNTTFYAGKGDWRLPNISELSSLANSSQTDSAVWLNASGLFANVQTDYWTADASVATTPATMAYLVNLSSYGITTAAKTGTHNVWPVRGGYIASPGRPFSLSTNAINFGTVPGRTTSGQTVFTITNDVGVQLNVTGTTVTGDGTLFKHDPNAGAAPCGADSFVLPVGGSCTMSAAFSASQNGPQTATLTVTSDTSSESIALSAIGGPNSYTISVTPATGGVVACNPAIVVEGASSVCTITPDAGKKLATFSDNGTSKLADAGDNSYTFSSVSADHTIAATFAVISYTVTTQKTGSGIIGASSSAAYNSALAITVTPATGQYLVSVSGCNGSLSGTSYTTAPLSADCMVSAIFAADVVPFSATTTGNGSVSCLPSPALYGDTVTCTLTPAFGYQPATTTDNGTNVFANLSDSKYILNNVIASHTLVAGFALSQYVVTPTATTGGLIAPATLQTLSHGSTTPFTATANTGYHLVDFTTGTTCGGTPTGSIFTTTAITGACSVQANFAKNSYNVISAKTGNGTIVTEGTQQALYGDTVSFTVTPANGSHLVSITGCGVNLSYNGNSQTATVTATTSAISTDCSINALFALNGYTVTAFKIVNGIISPTGAQPVTFGNSLVFTLTPGTGQQLKDVTGDCGGILNGTTFTTTAASTNCSVIANFIPQTFAVTTNSGVNSKVTFNPVAVEAAAYGSIQTFQLTPDAGYTVAVATGCNNGTLSAPVNGVYTYTTGAITQACAITATALVNSYTVTLSPGANGSITGGATTGTTGQVLTFTANPAIGYHLNTVSGCGASFTAGTTTITTAPLSAYCTMAATFAANQYTVTTSGSNVIFNPTVRSEISHGATTTFSVTPAISHNITGVSGCSGSWDSVGGIFTTGSLTSDCTVTAAATIKTFVVTSPGAISNGSISCSTPINYDSSSACTIALQTGYHLASFAINGVSKLAQLSNNSYSIANVTAPLAVTGSFAIDTFTVTVSSGDNGSVTAGATYNYGESKQYDVTPAVGYHIVSVMVDGAAQTISNLKSFSTIFSSISDNHTVAATFAIDTFTVVSSKSGTGSGTIICVPALVSYGGSSLCTMTPSASNKLTALTDNGGNIYNAGMINGGSYTISSIAANHTVIGTFVDMYTITATQTANGSITPAGTGTYDRGTSINYAVTPNAANYHVTSITIDGSTTTYPGNTKKSHTESFTNISANHTVTAIFAIDTFTVGATVTGSGSGTVTCLPATVNYGGSSVCTITPVVGNMLMEIADNASSVFNPATMKNGGSYTVSNVIADHAVVGTFVAYQWKVTAIASGNGGSLTPVSIVYGDTGAQPAFKLVQYDGYQINPLFDTCGSTTTTTATPNLSDLVVQPLTKNCELTFTFVPYPGWFEILTTVGAGGSITPISAVFRTASKTITVTPNSGYHIISVFVDGTAQTLINLKTFSVSFTNIVAGHTVNALFAADTSDFNGDGRTDVLWTDTSDPTNNTYTVWNMNGVTKISESPLTNPAVNGMQSPGVGWALVAKGDFDKDGKADIVWRNQATGQNIIWFMNGAEKKGEAVLASLGGTWDIAGCYDLDKDGNVDIIWRNSVTGANSVWIMSGTTRTKIVSLPLLGGTWQIVGVGDFDNDGNVDILWRNHITGANSIWIMDGNVRTKIVPLAVLGGTWQIAGTGDFNNDGKIDILWRNPATGANSVWVMDGTTRLRISSLPILSGANWQIVGK